MRCSTPAPVGELHPVQGLLERFEAGPGCAARELGNKETHVIAVGRLTNSPENKVTSRLEEMEEKHSIRWFLKTLSVAQMTPVLLCPQVRVVLKPLSASPFPFRAVQLLLSSRLPLSWWLEAERLPANLPVLVQVGPCVISLVQLQV